MGTIRKLRTPLQKLRAEWNILTVAREDIQQMVALQSGGANLKSSLIVEWNLLNACAARIAELSYEEIKKLREDK